MHSPCSRKVPNEGVLGNHLDVVLVLYLFDLGQVHLHLGLRNIYRPLDASDDLGTAGDQSCRINRNASVASLLYFLPFLQDGLSQSSPRVVDLGLYAHQLLPYPHCEPADAVGIQAGTVVFEQARERVECVKLVDIVVCGCCA